MIILKIIANFAKFFNRQKAMGKFTEFKLPLKSMPVGAQSFEYKIGKQFFVNMENNDVRNANIGVKLTVTHKNDFYELDFSIAGEVTVACDRCLDDLRLPIETAYHTIVKFGEDYNDENDDFLVIPESDNHLNVAYMLRDTIVLAIPIKHVHPLGKCNRAMNALLKKHRSAAVDNEEAEMENDLIDEIDSVSDSPTDSRWDKLKGFNAED